jgi:hypothetical protein
VGAAGRRIPGEVRRCTALVAGLIALTGGNALNRSGTAETRVLLGTGPDHEDPTTGGALTSVGICLFVAPPLFVAGGLLYGSG